MYRGYTAYYSIVEYLIFNHFFAAAATATAVEIVLILEMNSLPGVAGLTAGGRGRGWL